MSLVSTNERGGLVNRQVSAKALPRASKRAGIDPKGIATHSGRRIDRLRTASRAGNLCALQA